MNRNQRKRSRGSRQEKPAILIVCQGAVTEPSYFNQLKRTYHSASINIEGEPLSPLKLVKRAAKQAGRDYSHVFVVIDRDDSSKEEVSLAATECKHRSTKQISFELIESNSCFEVWLHAHYGKIPAGKKDRNAVQKAVREKGAVDPARPKYLSPDFPLHEWENAQRNITITEPNEIGREPSTAVPHVCKAIADAGRQKRTGQ